MTTKTDRTFEERKLIKYSIRTQAELAIRAADDDVPKTKTGRWLITTFTGPTLTWMSGAWRAQSTPVPYSSPYQHLYVAAAPSATTLLASLHFNSWLTRAQLHILSTCMISPHCSTLWNVSSCCGECHCWVFCWNESSQFCFFGSTYGVDPIDFVPTLRPEKIRRVNWRQWSKQNRNTISFWEFISSTWLVIYLPRSQCSEHCFYTWSMESACVGLVMFVDNTKLSVLEPSLKWISKSDFF